MRFNDNFNQNYHYNPFQNSTMGEFIAEFFGQVIIEVIFKGFLRLLKNIGIIFLQLITLYRKSFGELKDEYRENALPYWLGLIILCLIIYLFIVIF